jgi:hypothetical protein
MVGLWCEVKTRRIQEIEAACVSLARIHGSCVLGDRLVRTPKTAGICCHPENTGVAPSEIWRLIE